MLSAHDHSADGHRGKGRPRAFDRSLALRRALEVFWQKGYAPASVAELCEAMGIKPPSLYAGFGNKSSLFIEAVRHYEREYWTAPNQQFFVEPDIYRAVAGYFDTAATILLSPDTPCGCMVVLAAVNISESEREVIAAIALLRQATKDMFAARLHRAVVEHQLPPGTEVSSLACALNTFLEGLSIQARDGLLLSELKAVAAHAVRLLPPPPAK